MNKQPTYSPWLYIFASIALLFVAVLMFIGMLAPGSLTTPLRGGYSPLMAPIIGVGLLGGAVVCALLAYRNFSANHRTQALPVTMSGPELNNALKQNLHFTDADLEANRNGKMTEEQRTANTHHGLLAKKSLEIKTIEGQVTIIANRSTSGRYGGPSDRYWLKVKGTKLMLTEAQSKAFWSGASYRIYYLPKMYGPVPVFLSAEVINRS